MSSKSIEYITNKSNFAPEAFYSFLNDSATDCNTFCGSGNQTCFKNCIVKNKLLIDTMRDYVLYNGPREKNINAL